MLRFRLSPMIVLALLAATPATAADAPVTPAVAPAVSPTPMRTVLTDGTTRESWTLPNGLRVVTRHIAGAKTTAITLSYRLGTREDPPSHEGLAELVAQVAFTGRCVDVPVRSMIELDQLRPAGWSLRVGPHLSEMTEACPPEFLPGVLHQVAARLQGVAINDTLLRRARTDVQRRLRAKYDLQPEKTLYFLSGEMAAGHPAERAMRYATGEGLAGVTARDVSTLISQRLCPANTVLCVVGDLTGFNLHTLIERQLAAVPAGTAAPSPEWGKSFATEGSLRRPDLRQWMGVVAVIAPALTDTMHAYFTAFTVSAAAPLTRAWGKPEPPLTTRFQYSIATDPELARFYPPVRPQAGPGEALTASLDRNGEAIVDSSAISQAAESMIWLVGGELPGELLERSHTDATVIHTLATTLAALASYAGEPFWMEYRARLLRARQFNLAPFFKAFDSPRHRITLSLRPQD